MRNLRKAFEDLCPRLLETFEIRSILTLCVENVFSEMRSGPNDMSLQFESDRSLPRTVRERLRRQCFCSFNYFTHAESYYPQVTSKVEFQNLPSAPRLAMVSVLPEQVERMRCWRAEHGQSVPKKTVTT